MERVLAECDNVHTRFAPGPVHDLRVALRRCRSIADGLMTIDPDPSWKRMKRAGKKLFSALGNLRDSHVMTEWVEKLSAPDDEVAKALAALAAKREVQFVQEAMAALEAFDRKGWSAWIHILPQRASRIGQPGLLFRHLALERWGEGYDLHRRAIRDRSQVSFHRLRIGLKRFRYILENFLPEWHAAWIDDLKHLQDILGNVHDLDVLWAIAVQENVFPDPNSRQRWHNRISQERSRCIAEYRAKMLGRRSLWHTWRSHLPQQAEVRKAALARLKTWASLLDPDFRHSQRVTQFALQLYDGLLQSGLIRPHPGDDARLVLQVAGLAHDIGRSRGPKKHHKAGARLLRRLKPPLGLGSDHLQMAALVARHHRGALPHTSQKAFARLTANQRKRAGLLAGILRLADALDTEHEGIVRKVAVSHANGTILVKASGYAPNTPLGQRVAAGRHLLEMTLARPILVRPMDEAGDKAKASRNHRPRSHSKMSGSRSAKKAL
jgi:exopolyphosphatase/guanosine-5'-triphosphate,3'-diphosphate pyrophosphatase